MRKAKVEFHPLEITRQAYEILYEGRMHFLFAGGIFYLFACLVSYASHMSGDANVVRYGDIGFSIVMYLASLGVGLIGSARALGVTVPFLPSALLNERQFWKYGVAGIVTSFLVGATAFVGAGIAGSLLPPVADIKTILDPGLIPAGAVMVVGIVVAAVVSIKIALLQPAVVLGEKIGLVRAWKRSNGMEFRLLAASILTIFLLIAIQAGMKNIGEKVDDLEMKALISFVGSVLGLIQSAAAGALYGLVLGRVLDAEESMLVVPVLELDPA